MTRRLLTGLTGLALLAAALLGLPTFLIAVQRTLARTMPSLAEVPDALLAPGDGGLFLLTMLGVGWICWLVFVLAFAVEIGARVRGVRTPRLGPFVPQRSAAWAITAITLLATLTPNAGGSVQASPSIDAAASVATSTSQPALAAGDRPKVRTVNGHQEASDSEHAEKVAWRDYRVRRGDTLWDIADKELGDPTAWPRIDKASEQIPQPGGQHLEDPDLILPGWTLHIPDPAASTSSPNSQPEDLPEESAGDAAEAPETAPLVTPRATPLRPSAGAHSAARPAMRSAETKLPATPLSADRRPSRGVIAAAGSGGAKEPATTEPEHLYCALEDGSEDVAADHSVPGLPAWIRSPAKPTQLHDDAPTRSLVLAVLAEQRSR